MTKWQFYTNTDQAWEGMLAAIAEAKESIDCEQYIFENDSIGRQFLELFVKKAKQGVRVRLLVDGIGSLALLRSSYLPEAQRAGVKVQFFNPLKPWWVYKVTFWFLRDHRKVLVVDEKIGFTGGVGVRIAMTGRRDTHVRVTGAVVRQLREAFEAMWQATHLGERYIKHKRQQRTEDGFLFITNTPRPRQRFFYHELRRRISSAQSNIYLVTPYFVPDRRLFRALKKAVRRGVTVNLIVPEQSDHPFVDIASQSYFWLALHRGVRIWLHQDHKNGDNLFIHSKAFVVDDNWASVGSTNLDNLSLLLNYEGDLTSTDPKFVAEVTSQCQQDIADSVELTRSDWKRRRTFRRKLAELSTWPFHRLM
ncbi:MAG: hypothetical protein COU11_03050 [Candidatus Harrisonbacteria bacterium CG10_big_fil_rev_8_21_14_0_10_49_15]|uniref:PLD phosphodiesterase domain-containing protein n=1 Tax=Candidatus Harrisonbacteria bacterium CG10_big_fil_rev_8_21_14_0_10_49_15 TaxID=1974587 RepID=A0A2H0UKN3_9BACT|nr:MAG: hypothetical protein COU11_03050 [Candidatus Harrisonbacteria bacterium CG10_big_fil_rev_8_21_14_0_10_49_15]